MNWMKRLVNPGANEGVVALAHGLVTYVSQVLDQRFAGFEKIILFSLPPTLYISLVFSLVCSYMLLLIMF